MEQALYILLISEMSSIVDVSPVYWETDVFQQAKAEILQNLA